MVKHTRSPRMRLAPEHTVSMPASSRAPRISGYGAIESSQNAAPRRIGKARRGFAGTPFVPMPETMAKSAATAHTATVHTATAHTVTAHTATSRMGAP